MSSHREAPEISKDPVADNTDVYAFVSPDKPDMITLIMNYIPWKDLPEDRTSLSLAMMSYMSFTSTTTGMRSTTSPTSSVSKPSCAILIPFFTTPARSAHWMNRIGISVSSTP
jgi:hypothetical protein